MVLVLSTIGYLSTDIYLPSLPAIHHHFATTSTLVQLTVSLYLLTFSLSQFFYGPTSDRYGRRPIALFGMVLSLCATVLCMLSPNITTLLIGRLIQGMGTGAGAALGRAILRDVYSGHRLAHYGSFLATGTAILMAAAPSIGGYIQHYLGWRYDFGFLALYILILLLGIRLILPETNLHPNPHAIHIKVFFHNYRILLLNPIFLGNTFCGSIIFSGLAAYLTSSPFLFQNVIGISPVVYGWLAFVIAGGLACGGVLNLIGVKKRGSYPMLRLAILVALAGAVVMLVAGFIATTLWTLIVPMFVYMVGLGMAAPNAFTNALTPFPKVAGSTAALNGGIQIFISAIASAIMAVLPDETQRPLAIVLIGCSLLGLAAERWARQHVHD